MNAAMQSSLREAIRIAMGMPLNSVRPSNQHAPAEVTAEEFATVLIINTAPTGQDDSRFRSETPVSNTLDEAQVGQRRVTASVQFYRGEAMDKANALWQALNLSPSLERLQVAGFGLVAGGTPKDLSALSNTRMEPRAQVDLTLTIISKVAGKADTFGTFPVSVTRDSMTANLEVVEP